MRIWQLYVKLKGFISCSATDFMASQVFLKHQLSIPEFRGRPEKLTHFYISSKVGTHRYHQVCQWQCLAVIAWRQWWKQQWKYKQNLEIVLMERQGKEPSRTTALLFCLFSTYAKCQYTRHTRMFQSSNYYCYYQIKNFKTMACTTSWNVIIIAYLMKCYWFCTCRAILRQTLLGAETAHWSTILVPVVVWNKPLESSVHSSANQITY